MSLNLLIFFIFQMTLLTLGYDVTNTTVVLKNLADVLFSRGIFRPGEGAKILELLELILKHLNRQHMGAYVAESVSPFYLIVDFLLSHEDSLLTDQVIYIYIYKMFNFNFCTANSSTSESNS